MNFIVKWVSEITFLFIMYMHALRYDYDFEALRYMFRICIF